jgi:3-hydroxyacyl-CoA dehydrogenase
VDFAKAYAKNLKKVIVPSNDYAGFIGNGHFMRDALHGIHEVEKLAKETGFPQAVYIVNRVSQEYLVRPMGIFQLIDYVGIDVVQFIMNVMNPYLKNEDLHSGLLDSLMDMGVKGGQNSDGSQKDGFLKYEKGKITAVFDPQKKEYVAVADLQSAGEAWMGALNLEIPAWKSVVGRKDSTEKLGSYFSALSKENSNAAMLAISYLKRSREIGRALVDDGVAATAEDVNMVLLTGFYHAYGPINDFI